MPPLHFAPKGTSERRASMDERLGKDKKKENGKTKRKKDKDDR